METKGGECYNSQDIVQSQRKWKGRGILINGIFLVLYIYIFKDSGIDLNCFFNVLLFFFALDSMLRLDHDGDKLY